jgi:dimethylaniline monooxygenase (N-oxide forming)
MTHPDLWDDIHRSTRIKVHRGEIQSFARGQVQLEGGSRIQADMVILATGWKTTHSLFSSKDRLEYGLPSSMPFGAKVGARWSALESEADQSVVKTLPLLARSPEGGKKDSHASYRLYRHIVPVPAARSSRNIAYVGMLRTAGAPLVYEAQSLWAVAYLTGKLSVPSVPEMEQEIAHTNAWIRRRYVCGWKVPFALFDFMPVSPR